MSLIIKGVDMPKSGESITYSSKEIIEIPRPHGRLIDADKFLKDNAAIADQSLINLLCRGTLRDLIDNAPTVIEAEVSK